MGEVDDIPETRARRHPWSVAVIVAVLVACATAAVGTRLIVSREGDRANAERARAAAAAVRSEIHRSVRETESLVALRRGRNASFDALAEATVGAAGAAAAIDVRLKRSGRFVLDDTAIVAHRHAIHDFDPSLLVALSSPAARYGVIASPPVVEHDGGRGVWFVAGIPNQRLDGPQRLLASFVPAQRLLGRSAGRSEPAVLYSDGRMVTSTGRPSAERVERSFPLAGSRWRVAIEERSSSAAARALPWTIAGAGLAIAWLVIMVTGRIERIRRNEIALLRQQETARTLAAEAAFDERQRIARDLHDSVSQTLFSMTLQTQAAQLSLARDGHEPESTTARAVRRLSGLTRDALSDLRALIFALRPSELASQGLVGALRHHADTVAVREGLPIVVSGPDERLDLDADAEEQLYRVGIEAIQNAVKHASARRLEVDVQLGSERGGDVLRLLVRDDGVGFDVDDVPAGHLGLESMRERVENLGARLDVESGPGEGTTVTVTLALARRLEELPA